MSNRQKASSSVDRESLNDIPLSYASCSIGCKDEHTLPKRLDAISAAGFTGIELSMPDLVTFANQHLRPGQQGDGPDTIDNHDFDNLCAAAKVVKTMCDAKGLKIMMLQPFANFEGWPEGSAEREDAFTRAGGWMRVMEACGTDMLQIGSSDSPEEKIGNDRNRFVSDLREIADMLAKKNFRIAYENWCWSTHSPDWADVWDICKKVDRPNFGLCLDTFQSAGGEWGDPTSSSGMLETGTSATEVTKTWQASCQRLVDTIQADKIYLLQISDAYKPEEPFKTEDIDGMRPRARWSGAFRPLPFEGYLPVVDFTKAVLQTGFRGWFSYEIFDGGPDGKGKDYEMGPFAKAAMDCQRRLMDACVEI
jgi:sugar phosphate isomerase/epimerase